MITSSLKKEVNKNRYLEKSNKFLDSISENWNILEVKLRISIVDEIIFIKKSAGKFKKIFKNKLLSKILKIKL